MVVISFYSGFGFLEAYVIKSSKRGAADVSNSVIGYEKVFFPPHKHIIGIAQLSIVKCIRIEALYVLIKLREFALKLKPNGMLNPEKVLF